MLTPIDIHHVHPSDTQELLALSRKTFYDAFEHVNNPDDFKIYSEATFHSEKILAEINNPLSSFYFALIDGQKVGYIKLNYSSAQAEFKDDDAMEIARIYVKAGQQGKQIGKQLIDFAIEKGFEKKLRYIWLGVWEHNHSAIRFYEREGFKQFSSHDFWVGNDRQTDLLMKRELV
jgi:hypothetical protein